MESFFVNFIKYRLLAGAALFFLLQNGLTAGSPYTAQRRYKSVYRTHPAKQPAGTFKKLILINDFNRDGKLEAAETVMDMRMARDAIFAIYGIDYSKGTGKRGEQIFQFVSGDYYCTGIEFKNIDDKPGRELLFHTSGKNPAERYLYPVRWNSKSKQFQYMKPNAKIFGWQARFKFQRRSLNHPPELVITTKIKKTITVFQKVDPLPGKKYKTAKPAFVREQIFILTNRRMYHYSTATINTPLYILHKFLSALQQRAAFSAYRHVFTSEPYFKFKAELQKRYPVLTGKQITGELELNNWFLDYYSKYRRYGWLTFSYRCIVNGKRYLYRYQVFMKKIYDEWKITAMRVIRKIKLEK